MTRSIAGTGLTTETDLETGLPYAECVVFNGSGKQLWQQRKIHPWVMSEKKRDAGVKQASSRGVREHFYPGNTVVVAETPIGRCVILICEDMQQEEPGRLILNRLRPRWVFAPILDTPIEEGRWPAERAKELSRSFGATVVVCNSLALLPEDCSEETANFGWIVRRSASGNFLRATVNVPIAEKGPAVLDIPYKVFKRLVTSEES